ncbi:MAG: TOBE domain-containing protein, partial [Mogibacterium sp.]|nr:TOBE domain-containing protein [Mogibacterium sp.]
TTFIYVTHDQTEAMTLGDRIVIMKGGFIQQIGTPQEVFDHPANLFVAGFIGTPHMNIFDAELKKDKGKYSVVVNGVEFPCSRKKQAEFEAKGLVPQKVKLGIRPEHLNLSDENSNSIPARVDVSEMMGSSIHLHANAGGKDVVLVLQAADLSDEHRTGYTYGSDIRFTFDTNLMHLFNEETGENLI